VAGGWHRILRNLGLWIAIFATLLLGYKLLIEEPAAGPDAFDPLPGSVTF
jgi:hypothetical protein